MNLQHTQPARHPVALSTLLAVLAAVVRRAVPRRRARRARRRDTLSDAEETTMHSPCL